ncbi:MAG: hypothetical protein ABIG11_04835, partial [bacterium]
MKHFKDRFFCPVIARYSRSEQGSLLLETILAILIMSMVGIAFISMIQKATIVSFKTREQMTCSRMAQTSFARIKNMDFYQLFAADSSQANFGLQAAYPCRAILEGIQSTIAASKFDRFRISVQFMRRDTADLNGNGMTSDLVLFTDSNSDLIDDYDSAVRYQDNNFDGDYYDTFISGGRTVAEQPDTHIKQVTVDVFRRGRLACSQTELVSLEQYTGDPNPSSEAVLSLLISTPVNSSYMYSLQSTPRQNSWNLIITKPYPGDIYRYRADNLNPLVVAGETDPLASVQLYVNGSGVIATITADATGNFSYNPLAVTQALVEGANQLRGQAVKDSYTSPVVLRTLIYDTDPPVLDSPVPSGTIDDRSPYVAAVISDPSASTTTTSGICQDVLN